MSTKLPKAGRAGFKRTLQRLAILDYLEGNTAHPSVEEIFRAVSKRHPSMSLATVYNTLNALSRAGEVRELSIDPDRRRYDPDTSPHHHLICVSCRKIVDMPGRISVRLSRKAAAGYTIIGNHIEFYGTCAGCRRKNGKRAAQPEKIIPFSTSGGFHASS